MTSIKILDLKPSNGQASGRKRGNDKERERKGVRVLDRGRERERDSNRVRGWREGESQAER